MSNCISKNEETINIDIFRHKALSFFELIIIQLLATKATKENEVINLINVNAIA